MATRTHTGTALQVQDLNGTYRTASDEEVLHAARSTINRRFRRGKALTSPADSQEFLRIRLAHLEHEVFSVLWLDNRHRVIAFEELFRGTIDGASVHTREVVKSALGHNQGKSVLTGLPARSAGSGDGIAGHAQIVEDSPDIAGELADGGGDAVAALGLDQAGGKAAQACDVFRAVAGA
jgi:hypothetical protein